MCVAFTCVFGSEEEKQRGAEAECVNIHRARELNSLSPNNRL